MKKVSLIFVYILPLVFSFYGFSQDKPNFKFGTVKPDDFSIVAPKFDSGAHAVIIGDIGYSTVTIIGRGAFGYEFQRKLRIKILDINGVDAGKFEIPVYLSKGSNAMENIKTLKATTYNLEGGKVIETKFDPDQIFDEKHSLYMHVKKFTLPALKAGSIFEINYTIASDYLFDFRSWNFQHEYPCLWSEYQTEIPEYFNFYNFKQGELPYKIATRKTDARNFIIQTNVYENQPGDNIQTVNGLVDMQRWVMIDIPSIKTDEFTINPRNFRNRLDFELVSIHYPNMSSVRVMKPWPVLAKNYLEDDDFGGQINNISGWVKDNLKIIAGNATDTLELVKRIFTYVQDGFICTDHTAIWASLGLKKLIKDKKGNVADINLLLMALLKAENVAVFPVLISTRENGRIDDQKTIFGQFDYVALIALVSGKTYYLDASDPDLTFGNLPLTCYNNEAKVFTPEPFSVNLSADSIAEKTMTIVVLKGSPHGIEGNVNTTLGQFASVAARKSIRKSSTDEFLKSHLSKYPSEYTFSSTSVESVAEKDNPIKLEYRVSVKMASEDIIYFNPVFAPFVYPYHFSATHRDLPLELPFRPDQTYIVNFEIPDGYEIDELPKSEKVKLNETDGFFEYLISVEDRTVHLKTKLRLNKAIYPADDYLVIRDFFGYVNSKQLQQIVLKKKK